jgi:alpha-tubulin suppressor-like RCC1 family protein
MRTTRRSSHWRWCMALLLACGGFLAFLPTSQGAGASGDASGKAAKGKLFGWGSNNAVELAFDPTPKYLNPLENTSIGEVTGVAIGGYQALALRTDKTLWSWGNNSYGSLGDGTTISRFEAQQVPLSGPVLDFSSGDAHCLAVTADGSVWSWGWNSAGQLGIGTTGDRRSPTAVKSADGTGQLTGVVAVAAASRHSAALKADGTVWAWGWNSDGELGNTHVGPQSSLPVQVEGLTDVTAISLGFTHGLALKRDGTVWAWGRNFAGQLGDGTTTNRFNAVKVNDLSNIKAIAAGTEFSLALREDGTVYSWGFNGHGQLGIGPGPNRLLAGPVNGVGNRGILDNVIAISAGDLLSTGAHSLALLNDGTVASWGSNVFGQAGDGTDGNDRAYPVLAQLPNGQGPLTRVVAIGAGGIASLAIVGPSFGDLAGLPADEANAITQLAARGIIKGCDQAATPPLFCPSDHTLRAQMAALIVRAVAWSAETPTNPFTDKCDTTGNCVDDELWNAVGVLAAKNVAKGYSDAATCAPAAAPCYAARDDVLHAQVISFITRAMVQKGYWTQATTDNGSVYPNIPASSGHRLDFVTYTQYVGPVPGTTSANQSFAEWNTPSTRAWFALALWQAIK